MSGRLLVVDDDVHIRRVVELYLRDAGYDVVQAASGEEALQLADKEHFDIVLIDLILPRYGGFRLCEKLKSVDSPPRVIISSADDSQQSRDQAGEAGADGFLPKPFTKEQLLAMVSSRA